MSWQSPWREALNAANQAHHGAQWSPPPSGCRQGYTTARMGERPAGSRWPDVFATSARHFDCDGERLQSRPPSTSFLVDPSELTITCVQHYRTVLIHPLTMALTPTHEMSSNRRGCATHLVQSGIVRGPPSCKTCPTAPPHARATAGARGSQPPPSRGAICSRGGWPTARQATGGAGRCHRSLGHRRGQTRAES